MSEAQGTPLKNARQEAFCVNLVAGTMTQEQAAIAAGYAEKHARSTAGRLSTNVSIRERITELQQSVADSSIAELEEVCERLTQILRGSMADLIQISETGGESLQLRSDHPAHYLIRSAKLKTTTLYTGDGKEIGEEVVKELTMHDPIRAMELLSKLRGWIIDRAQIDMEGTIKYRKEYDLEDEIAQRRDQIIAQAIREASQEN